MQNDWKDESRNKRSGENNEEEGGYIFDSPSTSVYDNVKNMKFGIRLIRFGHVFRKDD